MVELLLLQGKSLSCWLTLRSSYRYLIIFSWFSVFDCEFVPLSLVVQKVVRNNISSQEAMCASFPEEEGAREGNLSFSPEGRVKSLRFSVASCPSS